MRQKSNVLDKNAPKKDNCALYSTLNCAATSITLLVVFSLNVLTANTIFTLRCLITFYAAFNFIAFLIGTFSDSDNFNWTFDRNWKLKRKIAIILRTSLIFTILVAIIHVFAILFGAAVFSDVTETFHFSLLLTTITGLSGCFLWGCDSNRWLRLILGSGSQTDWEQCWTYIGTGTIGGAWAGAIVIPLDWDRPWQVWPVSCVYGALTGHLFGNIYVLVTRRKRTLRGGKHV